MRMRHHRSHARLFALFCGLSAVLGCSDEVLPPAGDAATPASADAGADAGSDAGCGAAGCSDAAHSAVDGGLPAATCSEGGRTHAEGENWTCADGCNFCHCIGGQVAGSVAACALKACDRGLVVPAGECAPRADTCAWMVDGTYCTDPLDVTECPAGSHAIAKDAACAGSARCYTATATLRCETFVYTEAACSAAGGTSAYEDSRDAPWFPAGCPRAGDVALGELSPAPPHIYGLCCGKAPTACGARAGNTCGAAEYCAYEAGGLCGRGDAEAMCRPRPAACGTAGLTAVCGCDNVTYESACHAALAGVGVYEPGPCK